MDYKWKRIVPLLQSEEAIDVSDAIPLGQSWREFKARLKDSNKSGLREFNERLVRSLSIETGILERIYELDRGTTEALIQKGFLEELIQRDSTNIEPSTLVDILHDQEAAVHLVQELVTQSRPLTRGTLFELHAILTAHQETVTAVDQFGNRVQILLKKGAFKDHPNNPTRSDGSTHEYCPPEHVTPEIDTLLEWYHSYESKEPLLVSAWLHHRFTQIHPFQDGNGRVARTLV
ncbi:MAG TPA: Fic family protein, partial [Candidatus Acidoferrales bacterium]|nr:Fic family protein [Candidatus Acidoferrales bacterium]